MANDNVTLSPSGGVSGVYGRQNLAALRGWESGTTGIGGSVDVRLGHVQGVPSYDHNTVSIDEPLRLGRFIVAWTRTPPFFNEDVRKYFNYFFQDKVLEFSGLSDNEIEVMERTTGPVGRSDSYAGYYKETNGKFSLKIPEVKGSPVRKIMKYYMSGISDPVTGTAHFHGNTNLRFSKINYSGDLIYILLGPTMRPDDIEFSCMYLYAFPNKDLIGHLNAGGIGEAGQADLAHEIEFSGTYVQNDTVNRIAQMVTEAFGLYKDTNEDVILPSYLYDKYVTAGTAPATADAALSAVFGASLKSRVALAKTATVGSEDVATIDAGITASHTPLAVDVVVGSSDKTGGLPNISVTQE